MVEISRLPDGYERQEVRDAVTALRTLGILEDVRGEKNTMVCVCDEHQLFELMPKLQETMKKVIENKHNYLHRG